MQKLVINCSELNMTPRHTLGRASLDMGEVLIPVAQVITIAKSAMEPHPASGFDDLLLALETTPLDETIWERKTAFLGIHVAFVTPDGYVYRGELQSFDCYIPLSHSLWFCFRRTAGWKHVNAIIWEWMSLTISEKSKPIKFR